MDILSFMVMIVALSQLILGVGIYLIYSGKRNNALAGAGIIVISTIPLFAFIDVKELKMFIFFIIANLWIFAVLVALKAIAKKDEAYNQ